MVNHLTRSISVKASSHRRHCKQLCGRMEIPCWVTFTCSRKATLNWLKALLKGVIYANLRHGVQMFSQISRIPDLIRKFWAKKCGLYAGVCGIQVEYTANKNHQTLSQPKPWCNDSSVLNLHHGYYTTIMTSRMLFRRKPGSHGTNQRIRKSEFVQCVKFE